MSISIKKICSATPDEWDKIWRECDYATYFHSREWSEIWNVYTEGNIYPDAKLIIFIDGKKALLPLSYQKKFKGLVKKYLSSPAGTYGGWISSDGIGVEHVALMTKYLTKKLGNLIWRINPFDPNLKNIDIYNAQNDFTQYLNLNNGFDSIYKLWTKGHASAARKARKEGIIIKESRLWKEWEQYFKIYEDSIRRWGNTVSSRYSISLFKAFFKKHSPNIKLWLAYFEGKPIAGALCFYHNHHVVYWHGATLEEYFLKRPSNLLQYEIIKDACEKGYWWYDFNPSGGHEGVINFKKSFGTIKLASNVIIKENMLYKTIRNTYYMGERLYKNVIES